METLGSNIVGQKDVFQHHKMYLFQIVLKYFLQNDKLFLFSYVIALLYFIKFIIVSVWRNNIFKTSFKATINKNCLLIITLYDQIGNIIIKYD